MPVPNASAESPRPSAAVSAVEERVARRVIATHRRRLDWLLKVPEWQELFEDAVVELGLPGQRQGVGREAALIALPLEHKHEIVSRAISRFRKHLASAVGHGICRATGIERFNRLDLEDVLTARQWSSLRSSLSLRLAQEHRRYKRAQQLLFSGYGFVVETAVRRLVFRTGQRSDCLQEGALGLLAAIDRVDDSDREFAPYAAAWVRRRIRNYLMRERLPVHAPVNLISRASELIRDGAGDPEGADRLRRTESLLLECLRCPSVSFDQTTGDDGESIREHVVDDRAASPAEAAERADFNDVVGRLLLALTGKQREVLLHRFGLGGGAVRTLSETAREVGISHQQVSMRERRALQRMERVLQPLLAEFKPEVVT